MIALQQLLTGDAAGPGLTSCSGFRCLAGPIGQGGTTDGASANREAELWGGAKEFAQAGGQVQLKVPGGVLSGHLTRPPWPAS